MIFKTTTQSPVGALRLFASDRGLRAVLWPQNDYRQLKLGVEPIERADHPILVQAARQLAEYFAGGRRMFDVPLDPAGTPFQLRAWGHLSEIPYGMTRTYGEQAAAMGQPTASRAVGAANGRNPLSILVPCHRVIGADGSLTGFAGGLETKRFLLALEAEQVGSKGNGVLAVKHVRMFLAGTALLGILPAATTVPVAAQQTPSI